MKKLISDKKLYENVSYNSADVYDLSSLGHFRTDFYKKYPGRSLSFKAMKVLRDYIKDEFKDKVLDRNLEYTVVSENADQHDVLCSPSPNDYFTYSFHTVGIFGMNPEKILFHVEEKKNSIHDHPFMFPNVHAEITTLRTKYFCETLDYIDGRYSIECPLLQEEFTVSFRGTYVSPSVYQVICPRLDYWLLKTYNNSDLGRDGHTINLKNLPSLSLPNCSSKDAPKSLLFWIQLEQVWHLSSMSCYYSFSFDRETKECLKSKNIVMIGDSHMRYRHAALQKHGVLKASFTNAHVASDMLSKMRNNLARLKSSDSPVLIFNTGHWSLRQLDIATYISDMVETFEVIRSLKQSNPAAQVIWVESSALSYNEYHFRFKVNLPVAAMNDWINHNMRQLGADIIPAFHISVTMQNHTKDGAHYQEILEKDVFTRKDKVSVGGAIDSVLIRTICP